MPPNHISDVGFSFLLHFVCALNMFLHTLLDKIKFSEIDGFLIARAESINIQFPYQLGLQNMILRLYGNC